MLVGKCQDCIDRAEGTERNVTAMPLTVAWTVNSVGSLGDLWVSTASAI
jgi:hypothetical protein